MADRLTQFSSVLLRLKGASVARILVAVAGVHVYYANYAHRQFLWGPDGYLDGTGFIQTYTSLYSLARSRLLFDVIYHVGFVLAVLFAIYGGRALSFGHAAFFWSLYAANGHLFDGGDSYGRVAAIFMVGAVTNAYLSPGAKTRRARLRAVPACPSLRNVAHNTVVVLLVTQIVVVYLIAGLWKVAGPLWREGTVLYYIALLEDYRFAPWIDGPYRVPLIVNLASYVVVVFEVGFVFALRTRVRPLVVCAMAAMHVGIALTMGLVGFMINMFAGLALCLTDDDYARIRAFAERVRNELPRSEGSLSGVP